MALTTFQRLFRQSYGAVIGMVHVKALPGTPLSQHSIEELVGQACEEAHVYAEAGVDGVLVENMNDVPYIKGSTLGPETVAAMTRVCREVRCVLPPCIPCGAQILAGGNTQALAVSQASGLQFIRAECFVFSHVADEGLMDGCAGSLLRYRRMIGAEQILVLTDIKKKHSAHSMTADVSLVDTALAAKFFLADGVIVTGSATGQEANEKDVRDVASCVDLPVLVGSGVTTQNVHKFSGAHGFIVGSHFKAGGSWHGELQPDRVAAFLEEVKRIREE